MTRLIKQFLLNEQGENPLAFRARELCKPIYFLLMFLGAGFASHAQLSIKTYVPTVSLQVGGDARQFGISITNNGTSNETINTVAINQYAGVETSGGVKVQYNNTDIAATLSGDQLTINKLLQEGDSLVITYMAKAGCASVSSSQTTVNNSVSVGYTDAGGNHSTTANSDSYGIVWPQLSIGTPGEQVVSFNTATDLYIPIKNAVGSGSASTVQFTVTWPDATNLSVQDALLVLAAGATNGISVPAPAVSGNTWTYTFGSSVFAGLGLGTSLAGNQTFYIHYTITPVKYFSILPVAYSVSFGSGTEQCATEVTATENLVQVKSVPAIKKRFGVLDPVSLCDSVGRGYVVLTNTGSGPALFKFIDISSTNVSMQGLTVKGNALQASTDKTNEKKVTTLTSDIDGTSGFYDADKDGDYFDLAAGDSVRVEFSYTIPQASLYPVKQDQSILIKSGYQGVDGTSYNMSDQLLTIDYYNSLSLKLSGATDLNSNAAALDFSMGSSTYYKQETLLGNRTYMVKVTAPGGYSINGGGNVFTEELTDNQINKTVQVSVNDNATCGTGSILWEVYITQADCPGKQSRIASASYQTSAHTALCVTDTSTNYAVLSDFHLDRVNAGYVVSSLPVGPVYENTLTTATRYTETNNPNPKKFSEGDTVRFSFTGIVHPGEDCQLSEIFAKFYHPGSQLFTPSRAYFVINGVQYESTSVSWNSSTRTCTATLGQAQVNALQGTVNVEAYIVTVARDNTAGINTIRGIIGFSCSSAVTVPAVDRGDQYTFTSKKTSLYTSHATVCSFYANTTLQTTGYSPEYHPTGKISKISFTQYQGLNLDKNDIELLHLRGGHSTNVPFTMSKTGDLITMCFDTIYMDYSLEQLRFVVTPDTISSGSTTSSMNVSFYDYLNPVNPSVIETGFGGYANYPVLALSTPAVQSTFTKNVSWTLLFTATNGGFNQVMQWYPVKNDGTLKIKGVYVDDLSVSYVSSGDTVFFQINNINKATISEKIRIDATIEHCSGDSLMSSTLRSAYTCSTMTSFESFKNYVSPSFDRTLSVRNTGFALLPSQPSGSQDYGNLCDTLPYGVDINPYNVDSSEMSFWFDPVPANVIITGSAVNYTNGSVAGQSTIAAASLTKPFNKYVTTGIIQANNISTWRESETKLDFGISISCDPNSSVTDITNAFSFNVARRSLCGDTLLEKFRFTPKIRGFENADQIVMNASASGFDATGTGLVTVTVSNLFPSPIDSVNIVATLPAGVSFVPNSTSINEFDYIISKKNTVVWAFKRGKHMAGSETLSFTFNVKNTQPCVSDIAKIRVASSLERKVISCNGIDSCMVSASTDSATVELQRHPPQHIASVTVPPSVCQGESFTVAVVTNTPDAALSYATIPATAGSIASNIVTLDPQFSGNLDISITADDGNCVQDTSVSVEVKAKPQIDITPVTVDENYSTVNLTATPAGGTWSGDGVTGDLFDPMSVAAGTHTITYTVMASNGCSASSSISVVTVPNCKPSLGVQSLKTCSLYPVTIPVNVSDIPVCPDCGLNSMKFEVVYDAQKLQYNALTKVKNADMYVDATAGRIEVQMYRPLDAINTFSGGGALLNLQFTPLATGTTTVSIENAYVNGISENSVRALSAGTIEIGQNPDVAIQAPAAVCPGQTVTVTPVVSSVSSNITYKWLHDGEVASTDLVLQATGTGSYEFVATDDMGCHTNATTQVDIYTLPTVIAVVHPAAVCRGEQSSVTATGAETYTWDNGVTNNVAFTPTESSTYSVTGTDSHGCSNTASVQVVVNELPVVTAKATISTLCAGSQTILTGDGASTYEWSHGVVNGLLFTPSGTETYAVTGTDNNGCSSTDSIVITVNPLPSLSVNASKTSVCSGEQVTLTASGADLYLWDNPVSNGVAFTPTASGTYSVTGSNYSGCSSTSSVSITVNTLPVVNVNSGSFCTGSPFTIAATASGNAPFTYTWNTSPVQSTASITVQQGGTYVVTVADKNNCSAIATSQITAFPAVQVTATGESVCQGNNLTINATVTGGYAPYSYKWSSGETLSVISKGTAGTYTVSLTDANGCTSSDTAIVTVNPSPTVTTTGGMLTGLPLTLTATATGTNLSYKWLNGPSTKTWTVSAAGIYTVYVITNKGCTASDTAIVIANPISIADTVYICDEQNGVNLTIGCSSVKWFYNGSQVATWDNYYVNESQTGNYYVECTSGGKTTRKYFYVKLIPYAFKALDYYVAQCPGTTFTLDAGAGYTHYYWNTVEGYRTYTFASPATVNLKVTDRYGCSYTQTNIQRAWLTVPQASITQNGTLNGSNSVTLVVYGNYSSWKWSTGATSSTISVSSSGTYSVTAYTSEGCSSSISITVVEIQKNFASSGSVSSLSAIPTSSAITSYKWYNASGTLISAQTSSTLSSGLTAGTFKVEAYNGTSLFTSATTTLTASGSLLKFGAESSDELQDEMATGIDTIAREAISVRPIPLKDILFVSGTSRIRSIIVTDLLGRKVASVENDDRIKLGSLTGGVYFVTIVTDSGSYNKEITVIK